MVLTVAGRHNGDTKICNAPCRRFQTYPQGYGLMSLTELAMPVIAPNAEVTLRHVLESGVNAASTLQVCAVSCCCIPCPGADALCNPGFCNIEAHLKHTPYCGLLLLCLVQDSMNKRQTQKS